MSLKRIIKEIADLNNVYRYTMVEDVPTKNVYKFKTENDIEYRVSLYINNLGEKDWFVGFDSISSRQNKIVNPKLVLNTVFSITKDFYKKNKDNINTFIFHAGEKRERIYRYYVKKLFPTAEINPEGHDPNAFVVSLK